MRIAFIFRGAVFVFLGTTIGFGQAAADPWLILATGEKGSISTQTTRSELARVYGARNVVDQDIEVGEGETQPGTVLFPKDASRKIEILWDDPEKKTAPSILTIRGKASRWKAVHGISLGSSLKDLERLNSQPFHLSGFGWDYSGTVMSWDNGSLAAELDGGHGRVILRLDSNVPEAVDEDVSQVVGDRDFSSHHPVMQKLNPRVYEVVWVFPSSSQ
jgi:hypothetical protein